jgi:hypothetical protein
MVRRLGSYLLRIIPVQGISLSLLRLNFEWRVKYASDVSAGVEEAVLQRPFDWSVPQEQRDLRLSAAQLATMKPVNFRRRRG